jgi:hypothetical protein
VGGHLSEFPNQEVEMIFLRELDLLNGQRNVEDFTAGMLSRTSRINAVTTAGKPDPNVSRQVYLGDKEGI